MGGGCLFLLKSWEVGPSFPSPYSSHIDPCWRWVLLPSLPIPPISHSNSLFLLSLFLSYLLSLCYLSADDVFTMCTSQLYCKINILDFPSQLNPLCELSCALPLCTPALYHCALLHFTTVQSCTLPLCSPALYHCAVLHFTTVQSCTLPLCSRAL